MATYNQFRDTNIDTTRIARAVEKRNRKAMNNLIATMTGGMLMIEPPKRRRIFGDNLNVFG